MTCRRRSCLRCPHGIICKYSHCGPRDFNCDSLLTTTRYGVYAAVFIYKAELAGALMSSDDREDANSLVAKFIALLNVTGANDLHVARQYGRMLQRMWQRKANRLAVTAVPEPHTGGDERTLQGPWPRLSGMSVHDTAVNGSREPVGVFEQIPAEQNSAEFSTPQLADPDIGLVDFQILDAFSTQDFSDLLEPFDMPPMDFSTAGRA